jgi:coproporphyrinogen III oxidase-like Fe-S oxidoreductase
VNAGLYLHIPFCLTRCGYCDFNAYAGLDELKPRYVRALQREASLAAPEWPERFVSFFLGGGTPSSLEPHHLARFLSDLRATFDVASDAEVTIEANPDTVDAERLRERIHQPESVRAAYAAARQAGYDNVNLDLIYGAQGESLASWRRTLEETIALGPEHVSAYALTIEPATALGRKVAAGIVPAPDPDLQADMFELACELLGRAGYLHYEVSNWAEPGFECRHNLGYWERRAYLGLGAGAHSSRGNRRWWNLRPPEQYLEAVEAGTLPIGGSEDLDAADRALEETFLRLRTGEGVGADPATAARAERYLHDGLLERRNGSFVATEQGMLLLNELVLGLSGT